MLLAVGRRFPPIWSSYATQPHLFSLSGQTPSKGPPQSLAIMASVSEMWIHPPPFISSADISN